MTVLTNALTAGAQTVLETMFFTDAELVPAPSSTCALVRALVRFDGDLRGSFILDLEHGAAAGLAAAFFGIDAASLTPAQILEVASEAANMICGAALSRVDRDGHLSLAPPVILSTETAPPQPSISKWLATPEGLLRASIHLD